MFAWDSYRRFVQMLGNVSKGIPGERFEEAITQVKAVRGVKYDTDLDVDALKELTAFHMTPASIRTTAGLVAQGIDISTGLVLYQWDSLDHVPVTDAWQPARPPAVIRGITSISRDL